MREKFIAGNWKMHPTGADAARLAQAVANGVGAEACISVAVCPPFPYLSLVAEILKGSRVALGAQNLFPATEGALTVAVLDRQLIDGLADPEQAGEAHAVIRRRFAYLFGEESAQRPVIQYGGGVKPGNAAAMLAQPGVDGALIGGASLDAGQFLAIVQAGIGDPQSEGKSA